MTPFKKKALTFSFGLFIGIVIAGTFFILNLDRYFKEFIFDKSSVAKNYLFNLPHNPFQITKNNEAPHTETSKEKQVEPEIPLESKNKAPEDSLKINDSEPIINFVPQKIQAPLDDIVIRKDELLGILTLEINDLNPLIHKTYRDSLLEKMSEIKDDRKTLSKQLMNVEFWRSPLNYTGYKLSRNNLILYGLRETNNISIYMIDNTIYMRNTSIVYKLEYSNYFKPFDHIVEDPFSRNIIDK